MSTNKTIAKNTLFLYFRMFLTMGVGLYTSRLVLDALGVVDYGIYGLVGGIVSMFAFLNAAMSSATQRYLSFDIGKKDWDRLQKTFNATLNIHILIAIVIFILAETIGLWFVNTQLEIPQERMYAANWVYQFSIFTFILNVIQVPYNALLFAREHMSVYAYISILETVLKLAIVLYLVQADSDKLILYSILTFGVAFVIRMIYQIYCRKRFPESKYKFYWNKAYYKELMSYSGWSLFGHVALIARNQGINVLLNLFSGITVNTAYLIANQVNSVVSNFSQSFQAAVNPSIIKNYSQGKMNEMKLLIFRSSKFSFYLLLIIIIPILINTEYIIRLWLKTVPDFSINFIRLILLNLLLENLVSSLVTGINATGRIKKFQAIIGTLLSLNLPISYIFLKFNFNPEIVFYVMITINIIAISARMFFVYRLLNFHPYLFVRQVITPIVFVCGTLFITYYLSYKYLNVTFIAINLVQLLLYSFIIIITTIILTFILGVSNVERTVIYNFIKSKINK